MNIILDEKQIKDAQAYTNVNKGTTTYRTQEKTGEVKNSGFALDISGTVMDNSAYTGHGRTAEEVMLDAGQEDITARRNYMAVMSNCMSDEDFAKLQEDGFHPGSTEIETVVTIVDHIKAALALSGREVVGYTDTISQEALTAITGSESFALQLQEQFREKDIPLTRENVEAVCKAWDILQQTGNITEGSKRYLVENEMDPTPENLYMAKYSAAEGADRQARGYYKDGTAGYFAEKPDVVDYEKLKPQMEKVISEAGFAVTEETLADAKWLLEKGIPLNTDTFCLFEKINDVALPMEPELFLELSAIAIADGKRPARADLSKTQTDYEKAAWLLEKTKQVSEEAVDQAVDRGDAFTLRNLFAAQEAFGMSKELTRAGAENIKGRRLLEEIRLSMTVQANLRLLRQGFQIETAPLEELVEKLKEAESSYQMALTGESTKAEAMQKASLYEKTLSAVAGIKNSPAAILNELSPESTLEETYEIGKTRAADYERAQERYEKLWTAPRADMGDSLRKAFRNVDDILQDLNLEVNEENRKAVRILGYNQAQISKEHIDQIKKMDQLLTGTIKELKPGTVLSMIREGMNPMKMELSELSDFLEQQNQESSGQEMESYSKFLYQMEKQKEITEEERSAYIGIYRLIHQVEKSDDAAVGAIWQSEAGFTLENLLSAVRTAKKKHMDYTVNDDFGGLNRADTGTESISDQIEKGFSLSQQTNREELKGFLEQAQDEQLQREYQSQEAQQIRKAAECEDVILKQLSDYGQSVTADHLFSAAALMRNPEEIFSQLGKYCTKAGKSDPKEEILKAGEKLLEGMESKDREEAAYEKFQEELKEELTREGFEGDHDALDIRAMSNLCKHLSFMTAMAKEENYQIPVEIGGKLTAINLKVIHKEAEESKAVVTMNSEAMGKIAVQLQMTEEGLEGFCICERKESTELLQDCLQQENSMAGSFYFATGEDLDLAEFSGKHTEGRIEKPGADVLYRAAKDLIGYIQEAGNKKGSMTHENQL